MTAPAIDYAAQPYLGSDVVAFVLALVAVLYLALWRRDGERGMGWFALGMGALSLWAATDRYHLPVDRYLITSPLMHLVTVGIAGLAVGLVDYLDVPQASRRPVQWLMVLPVVFYSALTVLASIGGPNPPRAWANLLVGASFTAMGGLALWAARREPRAGHAYIGTALLLIPLFAVGLAVAQADSLVLRYWSVVPVLVLALTLLTVSVLRRRRALEAEVARRRAAEQDLTALNASLESKVAERTADLHNIVAGLESFNRSVSHDLRGSLGGIAGAARLADDAMRRGEQTLAQRVLPLIAEQAESSTRLVAALLSLAQVGDATLERQVVDLQRLVREVVAQLVAETRGRSPPAIEVQDLPSAAGDPELLRRVFANLIGNAIKFTRGSAGARIEIGATVAADEITVSVRDNGVGFDAASAPRLFSPFVRLHGADFDGHGVGLSIVRRAVERHGGRVWAESQPGLGAVFRFSLPLAA